MRIETQQIVAANFQLTSGLRAIGGDGVNSSDWV